MEHCFSLWILVSLDLLQLLPLQRCALWSLGIFVSLLLYSHSYCGVTVDQLFTSTRWVQQNIVRVTYHHNFLITFLHRIFFFWVKALVGVYLTFYSFGEKSSYVFWRITQCVSEVSASNISNSPQYVAYSNLIVFYVFIAWVSICICG